MTWLKILKSLFVESSSWLQEITRLQHRLYLLTLKAVKLPPSWGCLILLTVICVHFKFKQQTLVSTPAHLIRCIGRVNFLSLLSYNITAATLRIQLHTAHARAMCEHCYTVILKCYVTECTLKNESQKGYGLLNIRFRSTFSLQYGHICFFPTMHQPLMQNSWNLGLGLRLSIGGQGSS